MQEACKKKNKCEKIKNDKGITLIALVVTIVILLILAGVSINLVLGENGIVNRAKMADVKTENGAVAEAVQLKVGYYATDFISNINGALVRDGVIDNTGLVNTEVLLGKKLKTGNGSGKQDVYIIEDDKLYYYDKEGNNNYLGSLGSSQNDDDENLPETDPRLFEVDDDGVLYLKNSDNYYGSSANMEWTIDTLVIPKTVDGKQVKKLKFHTNGSAGIKGWSNIKKVVIPEGVESIGDEAFIRCSKLKKVIISKSVVEIGNAAFRDCVGITSINLPSSVTSIGSTAFSGCTSLMSINIPSGVTSIGELAFNNCTGIKSINIPSRVTNMATHTFQGWTSNQTINCEASSKPGSWDSYWNNGCKAQINWGVSM